MKISVKDAKGAMPGCTLVTNIDEVNKRPPFTPGTQRLLKGDTIRVNITDESEKKLIWGKDDNLRGAYFVLATLIRGERELPFYHLFPSMLLRNALKKNSAKHSEDAKAPQYANNEGILELLPSQRLTDYMELYIGKDIVVEDVDTTETWVLDFVRIENDKIDLKEEKRPIRDELWIGTNTRFYTFEVTDTEHEDDSVVKGDSTVVTNPTEHIGG